MFTGNTMTKPLKTPPKTSQRPLFLRKRGFLNLQKGGKTPKIPGAVAYRGFLFQKKFTGKEPDPETGRYYYGARYLDPKTSRWLSGDPALGEYLPVAPLDDEAKKRNQNLPGMGGVFNTVNLHAYHYAGNNPVKYTDPDGRNANYKSGRLEIYVKYEDPRKGKDGEMLKPGKTYKGKIDGVIVYNDQTDEVIIFKVKDHKLLPGRVNIDIVQNEDGSYDITFSTPKDENLNSRNAKLDKKDSVPSGRPYLFDDLPEGHPLRSWYTTGVKEQPTMNDWEANRQATQAVSEESR
jgi:RHS repeat-associated protein